MSVKHLARSRHSVRGIIMWLTMTAVAAGVWGYDWAVLSFGFPY